MFQSLAIRSSTACQLTCQYTYAVLPSGRSALCKVTPQRLSQTVAVVHLPILVSQIVGIPLRIWLSLFRRLGRFEECLLLGRMGLVLPLSGISAGLSRAGPLGVGAGLVAAVLPVVVLGCCKVLMVSAAGLGVASMWLVSPVLSARL